MLIFGIREEKANHVDKAPVLEAQGVRIMDIRMVMNQGLMVKDTHVIRFPTATGKRIVL
jgi:hypothetical protein